jgi:hypothetical protein
VSYAVAALRHPPTAVANRTAPTEADTDREEHVPMAQFYTLEEAARVLGMNPEDLKAEAQKRQVRAFLDGGTWRFRVGDVDELARRRGMGSDAELRLSDIDIPVAPQEEPEEIDLSEFQLGAAPDPSSPSVEVAHGGGSDSGADQDILLDDLSLPPNATASSSVIIGMGSTGSRLPHRATGATSRGARCEATSTGQPERRAEEQLRCTESPACRGPRAARHRPRPRGHPNCSRGTIRFGGVIERWHGRWTGRQRALLNALIPKDVKVLEGSGGSRSGRPDRVVNVHKC